MRASPSRANSPQSLEGGSCAAAGREPQERLRSSWAARGWLLIAAVVACGIAYPARAQQSRVGRAIPRVTIRVADVMPHVQFLADDSLRGRDTPSPGLESAARYVEAHFRAAGLKPPPGTSDMVRRWTYLASPHLDEAHVDLELAGAAGATPLSYKADFFAIHGLDVDARVVAVGDARDTLRIAHQSPPDRVLLASLSVDAKSWFGPTHAAMRAARRAGAAGLMLAFDSTLTSDEFATIVKASATMDHGRSGVAVFGLSASAAQRVLSIAGLSRAGLDSLHAAAPIALTVLGKTPLAGVESHVPNVLAYLRGSDPRLRNEYVVVSAHMDHLGIGAAVNGDSIYNGADDNASGTSVVLSVAGALAKLPKAPRRSILFVTVSGEEKGVRGSPELLADSPVPIDHIVADINIDMVGRYWHRDTVPVFGRPYSTLGSTVTTANALRPDLHFTLVDDPWPTRSFFTRSDQFSFVQRGIPAIFFSTSGEDADYHKPSDEVSKIDGPWLARVASLVATSTLVAANADARPEWDAQSYEQLVGSPLPGAHP